MARIRPLDDPLDESPEVPFCDICAVEAGLGTKVLSFELGYRGHPAGTIDLCNRCWTSRQRDEKRTPVQAHRKSV